MNSSTILLLLLGACAFASAGKLWADVCTQSDTKGLPFCDMTKPVDVSSIKQHCYLFSSVLWFIINVT